MLQSLVILYTEHAVYSWKGDKIFSDFAGKRPVDRRL